MGRRGFVKIGTAVPAGVALATTYVAPAVVSIASKTVYAATEVGQPSIDLLLTASCSVGGTISGTLTVRNASDACVTVSVANVALYTKPAGKGGGGSCSDTSNATLRTPNGITTPYTVGCPTGTSESRAYSLSGIPDGSYRVVAQVTIADRDKLFLFCTDAICS